MMVRMGVYGLVGIWSVCCGRGNSHAWGDQEAVELCGQPCSSQGCQGAQYPLLRYLCIIIIMYHYCTVQKSAEMLLLRGTAMTTCAQDNCKNKLKIQCNKVNIVNT